MDPEFVTPTTPKKPPKTPEKRVRASPMKSPVHHSLRSPHSTPSKSPAREVYGDRFMPMRAKRGLNFSDVETPQHIKLSNDNVHDQAANRENILYQSLLRNEVGNGNIERLPSTLTQETVLKSPPLMNFKRKHFNPEDLPNSFSLSPISSNSEKLLKSPRKAVRKIPKSPFKVLDAPDLQDDFYLNLVDWSSTNVLSVGLSTCVYLWSAHTSQVTRLCDLAPDADNVNSVAWNDKGNYVAVGTAKGHVQIWDAVATKKIQTIEGHQMRVGALAWNGEQLSSGSRDRTILQRDIRCPSTSERKLQGHRQEICGLKWSPDGQFLASGGNDNKLLVWNKHGATSPMQTYSDHIAAVKAIAWSPHQHGLLASGGGTADRCIKFWNTLTQTPLQSVDTGSQVCNLAWSKHTNELVSTHGYSQNQILIWRYPSLTQVAKLTGHTYRVLYLATSPDGECIVTGAGDETLRFWNVFSKMRSTREPSSVLNLFNNVR